MGRLQDRVAIITGAGDGIGKGCARRFAAEGAKVLIAEINPDSGKTAADELVGEFGVDAIATVTDVGQKDQVLAMIDTAKERWGTVDILMNNAWGGAGGLGRVEYKSDNIMGKGMAIGFYGPLWAMQAAFPLMKAQGYGRVINVCSLNGVNAHIGSLQYNSAKEALRAATRTAAREWASYGITLNVICPAAKTAAARALEKTNPDLIAAGERSNPMGRMGDPEQDIAPVALFLASEDSRYLTGNTLFVYGGSHINGANWAPELPDGPEPE